MLPAAQPEPLLTAGGKEVGPGGKAPPGYKPAWLPQAGFPHPSPVPPSHPKISGHSQSDRTAVISSLLNARREGPGLDLQEMEIKWDLDANQDMLSCRLSWVLHEPQQAFTLLRLTVLGRGARIGKGAGPRARVAPPPRSSPPGATAA